MEKKTCSKFITLTAVVMCVLMLVYVCTMFTTIHSRDYSETTPASEFINNINSGKVKLKNESYAIGDVTCVSKAKGEVDLKALKGSDTEIRTELISLVDYTVISEETNKAGDKTLNVSAASDDEFDLKWTAYNSPAKLIWFPGHPTTKDFIGELRTEFYSPAGVEYDINDIVLFPVLMFVLGIAGAILVVVFAKKSFFLVFPAAFCIIGLIGHISGLVGIAAPQMFVYNIFNALAPVLSIIQLVLVVLVLAAIVVSVIFRKKLHDAVVAEEAAYYAQTK